MELGWRQGAILDQQLALLAWDHAPDRLDADDQDHLVVASHDCDILNASLTKEPLVEVLRARVPDARRTAKPPFRGTKPASPSVVGSSGAGKRDRSGLRCP